MKAKDGLTIERYKIRIRKIGERRILSFYSKSNLIKNFELFSMYFLYRQGGARAHFVSANGCVFLIFIFTRKHGVIGKFHK